MTTLYSPGTRVWLSDDSQQQWIPAEVSSCTKAGDTLTLVLVDENGKETTVSGSTNLPPLRNPELLETVDDLATLSHLNEPSILHAVQSRYLQRKIYTYSGIVLLAVNPFETVPLYTTEIVQQYIGRTKGELEPHLFAIAEDAYAAMVLDGKGQTIIVSGESGAGKTESAKLVMRFIAAPKSPSVNSDANAFVDGASLVEQQIQATNPILEGFGNAKTTRNDNSSRFGKYIQLLFDTNRHIVGARVRTYLLERSRVTYQTHTERNYHIFYQLCRGLPAGDLDALGLSADLSQFHYLNQGGPSTTELNDREKFRAMRDALKIVGIGPDKQKSIFELLSAVLHLGNIAVSHARTEAVIEDDDPSMSRAMQFLGVNAADFKKWTIKKQISTRSDKIVTALTPVQAVGVRDSLARFVYACLFEWLVNAVNESFTGKYGDATTRAETHIGVLDIYGFEHFEKNSFEQFCINYANEKLQHEFNTYVFKLAQEEYRQEKISWTFIDFDDNQPAIDLIEGKLGILALLDEESRLQLGTDASFLAKLNTQLDKPANKDVFISPKFANAAFTIAHYALQVTYSADGFLEKNRDTVPDEHLALLTSSSNAFLREVLDTALHRTAEVVETPPPDGVMSKIPDPGRTGIAGRGGSVKKPTLGSIFKGSLGTLMEMLRMTNVHYIRCLKPNDHKRAWEFIPSQVLAQLRAAGVLETIRISTAGYPTRWTFEEFARRYYMLIHWRDGPPLIKREQFKRLCVLVCQKMALDKTQYQMGETKIFLRIGVLAKLEHVRSIKINAVQFLQTNMRRLIAIRKYRRYQKSVIGIQSHWRGALARRAFREIRDKARADVEAAEAQKAALAAERNAEKFPSRSDKSDKGSEKGSPGKTRIRRMFSFGSKDRPEQGVPSPSPEPVPTRRPRNRLEAATKRLSRSWHDPENSPRRKAPDTLSPHVSSPQRTASPSKFSTPIYEQFMNRKPAWNSSTNLNH